MDGDCSAPQQMRVCAIGLDDQAFSHSGIGCFESKGTTGL
jgi:hypothetical protein